MDRIRIDWFLVALVFVASAMGVITLYGGDPTESSTGNKQLLWIFFGIGFMILFTLMNYQLIGSYSYILYIAGIFLLLITLMPFIGTKIKGARSWIRFFGVGIQSSEIMKLVYLIAMAKYLSMKENEIAYIKELLTPFLLTIVPVFLIGVQPDLGYSFMFIPLLVILLFIAGANADILAGFTMVGFFTVFIPMYMQYQRYIITDDIIAMLATDNYKLSEAVRSLLFDVWYYIDNASKFQNNIQNLHWDARTVLEPANLAFFLNSVQNIYDQKTVFLRDFYLNNLSVLIFIIVTFLTSTISYFIYWFYMRIPLLRRVAIITFIFCSTLTSSFLFYKILSFKTHQVIRLVSFANPDKFPRGAGYQLRHSIITLGSGSVAGRGYANGDMTKGNVPYLPEWFNDFVFSSHGEQFGFTGSSLLTLILFLIVIRGVTIAWQSKDTFGTLLAAGISTLFFLHIFINIGITIGIFPVTGIPLPFISYGGSNIVTSFIMIGMLLNINSRKYINT